MLSDRRPAISKAFSVPIRYPFWTGSSQTAVRSTSLYHCPHQILFRLTCAVPDSADCKRRACGWMRGQACVLASRTCLLPELKTKWPIARTKAILLHTSRSLHLLTHAIIVAHDLEPDVCGFWVFPPHPHVVGLSHASWGRNTRFKRVKLASWFDATSNQDPCVGEKRKSKVWCRIFST